MNFFSKLSLTGLLLASSGAMAVEPAFGWYTGFMLGLSWAPAINFSLANPAPPPLIFRKNQVAYGLGGNAGFQFGYRCYRFRYEGELMANYNKINKLSLHGVTLKTKRTAGVNIRGYTDFPAALFNLYYEFYDLEYSDTTWAPYIGLGIGYARVRTAISYFANNVKYAHNISDSTTPIGQAIFGVNYFLSSDMSLGTDLRYMLTRNHSVFDQRFAVVTWNLVFNYSFDDI